MDEELTHHPAHGHKKPLDDSIRSINLSLYSKAFSYTKHYNTLKMKYKLLTLGWVLATFIAFSYVLSAHGIESLIDMTIALAAVSIVSSRGVLLLLLLDAEVYHRILNASFAAGLEMERSNANTSRMHINMMKSIHPEAIPEYRVEYEKGLSSISLKIKKIFYWIFTGKDDVGIDGVFYDGLFYCGICFCLWIITGVSISIYLHSHDYRILSIICGILTPCISFIICVHLMRKVLKSGTWWIFTPKSRKNKGRKKGSS